MSSKILIRNGHLVRKHKIARGDLLICEGVIERIASSILQKNATCIDAEGFYIVPGFIDLHIHGAAGCDFLDGTVEAVDRILNHALAHGTTTLLSTVLTAPIEEMRRAMQVVLAASDIRIAGIYVEGPFFSPAKKGAQRDLWFLPPSVELYEELTEGFQEHIKLFSLAVELPGALNLVSRIKADGITPSLAHSDATFEQAMEAIEHGLSHFTHFFNGMRGFHHRDPGAVGAALLTPGVTLELIADGVHVHPDTVKLLVKIKGIDNICLITDAIRATGLEDGEYMVGDQKVLVREGIARLAEEDSLAGSTLTMNKAVKNMVEIGVPLPDAIRAATLVPARVLRLEHRKGSLEIGKDADLVMLSDNLEVKMVLLEGKIAYQDNTVIKRRDDE